MFDEVYGWPILDYEDTIYMYSGELIYGLQDWEFYSFVNDLDFYYGYCGAFDGIDVCILDLYYYEDDSDYEYMLSCYDYYTCDEYGCTIYTNYYDYYNEIFAVTLDFEDMADYIAEQAQCMYGYLMGAVSCESAVDGDYYYAYCSLQAYYFSDDAPYTPAGYYQDENDEYYYYDLYAPVANLINSL